MPVVRFPAQFKVSEGDKKVLIKYLSRHLEVSSTLDGFALIWGDAVSLEFGHRENLRLLEWAGRLAEHHKEHLRERHTRL